MQKTIVELLGYRSQLSDIINKISHQLSIQSTNFSDCSDSKKNHYSDQQNRLLYQQGRINDDDLSIAFAHYSHLNCQQKIATIHYEEIYRTALLFDFSTITRSQLNWIIQEQGGLTKIQTDVPEQEQKKLLNNKNEQSVIQSLWYSILNKLEYQAVDFQTDALIASPIHSNQCQTTADFHQQTRLQAETEFTQDLKKLGDTLSLRGLVMMLSGIDIIDSVQPQLKRIFSSSIDEGIATWHLPNYQQLGIYSAWRSTLAYDAHPFLHQLPNWQDIITELPENSLDCISQQLIGLNLPENRWHGYLQILTYELTEYSIAINRQSQHLNQQGKNNHSFLLADYLAIRLTLDRLWLNQVCHDLWKVDAKISALKTYFHKNLSEFFVRKLLYQGALPEYLTELAETLITRTGSERQSRNDWQQLADLLHCWQLGNMDMPYSNISPVNRCWQLFRLCQHLGFNADKVASLDKQEMLTMLSLIEKFNQAERNNVWSYAYQQHNQKKNTTSLASVQTNQSQTQIILCTEKNGELNLLRHHLEGLAPIIKTLTMNDFLEESIQLPRAEKSSTKKSDCTAKQHLNHQFAWLKPLFFETLFPWLLITSIVKNQTDIVQQVLAKTKHTDSALKKQTDLIAHFFKWTGLTNFSKLTIIMHPLIINTDNNQANINRSQVIARLANQANVRDLLLRNYQINIPSSVVFISALYHSSNHSITWYDTETLTEEQQTLLEKLKQQLHHVLQMPTF